jgi:hypothetical protein
MRKATVLTAAMLLACLQASAADRPNLLILLTDDQRWNAMGCAGNSIIQTPELDRLAKEGVLFTNAFVSSSICAASRASIFTGQFERAHGCNFNRRILRPSNLITFIRYCCASDQGSGRRTYLDLGTVQDTARVKLNGRDLGVVRTAPWRVEITDAVKPTGNQLEIAVVNLWPNRLIGDAALPPEKRFTVTNVDTYKKDSPLLPSGLLGTVSVMAEDRIE